MRRISRFYKGALAGLLVLVLMAGGIRAVTAEGAQQGHGRQNKPPVWEEVDRTIQVNPAKPAPPEVLAQLISLKVTYLGFDARTHYGIVEVNRALKTDVIDFFKYAYYLNFPIKEVAVSSDSRFGWDDNKLMDNNITSCFNYRTIAGTDRPSQHGLGRACDINSRTNPYIFLDDVGTVVTQPRGASWNLGAPGTLHAAHPLIQLMESRGWIWGGRWTLQDTDGAVIDYQHLQKSASSSAAAQREPVVKFK
jgi:hypothetical protein